MKEIVEVYWQIELLVPAESSASGFEFWTPMTVDVQTGNRIATFEEAKEKVREKKASFPECKVRLVQHTIEVLEWLDGQPGSERN